MLKTFWEKVLAIFSREDGEEENENKYVPSELDKSVRYAHGGSRQDIARELDDIERQADELEEGEDYE